MTVDPDENEEQPDNTPGKYAGRIELYAQQGDDDPFVQPCCGSLRPAHKSSCREQ